MFSKIAGLVAFALIVSTKKIDHSTHTEAYFKAKDTVGLSRTRAAAARATLKKAKVAHDKAIKERKRLAVLEVTNAKAAAVAKAALVSAKSTYTASNKKLNGLKKKAAKDAEVVAATKKTLITNTQTTVAALKAEFDGKKVVQASQEKSKSCLEV